MATASDVKYVRLYGPKNIFLAEEIQKMPKVFYWISYNTRAKIHDIFSQSPSSSRKVL